MAKNVCLIRNIRSYKYYHVNFNVTLLIFFESKYPMLSVNYLCDIAIIYYLFFVFSIQKII